MPATTTGRRRPAVTWTLVVLLVVVPIVETWILVQVGHAIGGLATVAILAAEALLGAWLLRREGSRALQPLRGAMGSGRMPGAELTDAALVLVGGVLLMLPGFLTDVLGLVFLLPFTRPVARRLLGWVTARQIARSGVDLDLLRSSVPGRGTVIEGEVVPGVVVEDEPTGGRRAGTAEPPEISGTVL